MSRFFVLLLLFSSLFSASQAWACNNIVDILQVHWPENTHLPVNTDIWIEVTLAEDFSVSLEGPDGEVSLKTDRYASHNIENTSFVLLHPEQPLETNTKYTLTLAYEVFVQAENGSHYETSTISKILTTTSEPMEISAPPQTEISKYFVDRHQITTDSECSPRNSLRDQSVLMLIDPPQDQFIFYTVSLTEPDGTPSKPLYNFPRIYNPQNANPPALYAYTLGSEEYPCVQVEARNLSGQKIMGEKVCRPTACYAHDERQQHDDLSFWTEGHGEACFPSEMNTEASCSSLSNHRKGSTWPMLVGGLAFIAQCFWRRKR